MFRFLILAILLWCSAPQSATAQEKRNATDYVALTATSALLLVDWSQTLTGLQRGKSESNPFLGVHPSASKVSLYMSAALIGNLAISRVHRRDVRLFAWAAVLLIEYQAVRNNHAVLNR